jgi:UDP-N-acetylglucosamine--N-acetylmuramyl-(pentapeptide) pyrophosphoryl-undecaprenol N-acetylglucosamine transferase
LPNDSINSLENKTSYKLQIANKNLKINNSKFSKIKNKKQKTIILTGGGTAGHVIPNLAIATEIRKLAPNAKIFYIGSKNDLEKKLVQQAKIKYFAICTGKLRRYFAWQNFIDFFRIPIGICQSIKILKKIKPNVVFAKGGFVSVPVALAAAILRIPLITHESDATPGLATKICSRFAKKNCLSFPTKNQKLKIKNQITGNPIRKPGSSTRAKKFLKFQNKRPIIFVVGGSSGAEFLNQILLQATPKILRFANLVWVTGNTKINPLKINPKLNCEVNLRIFQFLNQEYLDVLATADLVVSRAGANAIFEIAAANKPSLLIPLPKEASRGDQIINAKFFAKAHAAKVLEQKKLTAKKLITEIQRILDNKKERTKMIASCRKLVPRDATKRIGLLILNF